MRSSRLLLAACGLLTLAAASCKKETATSTAISCTDATTRWCTGRSVTYLVDSTVWDDFDFTVRRDTVWMRYTVADSFADAQGRITYAVNVDQRSADTLPWQSARTFSVTAAQRRIEVADAGLRFIKLISPVTEGAAWNGNAYINTADGALGHYAGWEYKYQDLGKPFNTGFKTYDDAVVIPAVDETLNNPDDPALEDAFAYRTLSKEVYAKNVGMVYRAFTRWKYDPTFKKFRQGFAVEMRAVEN